jgi:hypothetical protein
MIENGNVAKEIAELIKEAMNYNAINNQSPISIIAYVGRNSVSSIGQNQSLTSLLN